VIPAALILRASNPAGILVWCAIGFCAGIGLFFYGFRLLLRRRLILDTPLSKIRSASMGMVEISGQAVGPYTMIAPITERPCYYHRTLVWEYKQHGKNKQWVKVVGECMHVPFFVDDNSGRLLIDPRGADLDLHRDFQEEFCDSLFTIKDPAPDNVHRFLSRHGIVTGNKIKVEEYCIKPKNSLFILGTLGDNPGIEVGPQPVQDFEAASAFSAGKFSLSLNPLSLSVLSSSVSNAPVFDAGTLSSPAKFATRTIPQLRLVRRPLTSVVDPQRRAEPQKVAEALRKAGISSSAAWAAAGLGNAGVQAMGASPATPAGTVSSGGPGKAAEKVNGLDEGFDKNPAVVLRKGTNNKTFLISWRSQREVARALGWKCTLMIWGGPSLALLSLYLFLGIEHLL
jgi:hypothetical protein